MKSILITSNAYFPNIGGIENSLRYLAEAYRDKGYRVDVVVSNVNTVSDEVLVGYECLDGVHVHRYSTTHTLPAWLRPFSGLYSLRALFKTLQQVGKEHAPDLTVSRFHTTTWLAKLAGLKNVVYLLPGVVKYQNHPNRLSSEAGVAKAKQYLRYYYHVWLQNRALSCADKLFVFSQNMQEQVRTVTKSARQIHMTKPGVDHARFSPLEPQSKVVLRDQLGLPQSEHIFLCIGRFVAAKGFMLALNALKQTQGAHLVMVGGGEEASTYHRFVAQHALQARVTFAGLQQDPTPYYQASDSFIMSSTYEPLGQTILEAMSTALPIVAFEPSEQVITATKELLGNQEAVFVTELAATSLAKSIQGLVDSPEQAKTLGLRSRDIAVSRFSWRALADRLEHGE
ncbi:glycosyltransferase family 4 protein [Vibrio sp. DNB22_10_4]